MFWYQKKGGKYHSKPVTCELGWLVQGGPPPPNLVSVSAFFEVSLEQLIFVPDWKYKHFLKFEVFYY